MPTYRLEFEEVVTYEVTVEMDDDDDPYEVGQSMIDEYDYVDHETNRFVTLNGVAPVADEEATAAQQEDV